MKLTVQAAVAAVAVIITLVTGIVCASCAHSLPAAKGQVALTAPVPSSQAALCLQQALWQSQVAGPWGQ